MHSYKKVLEKANKPVIKKLAMWDDFVIDVVAPSFHDIRMVRASMKVEPLNENDDDETIRKKELEKRVRTAIVGWRGLKDDDGKEVPFSEDEAVALFTSDDMLGYAHRFLVFYGTLQDSVVNRTDWTAKVTGSEVETAIKK